MEGTREPFAGKGVLFENVAGIKSGFSDLLRELLGLPYGQMVGIRKKNLKKSWHFFPEENPDDTAALVNRFVTT